STPSSTRTWKSPAASTASIRPTATGSRARCATSSSRARPPTTSSRSAMVPRSSSAARPTASTCSRARRWWCIGRSPAGRASRSDPMPERTRRAGLTHRPQFRFACLAGPGAVFIVVALLLPLLSIVVFSFWRTESYELYADWNLNNYRSLLGEPAYRTFFLRSLTTAALVSLVCLAFGWPVAYFIAKHGGRYRLLLVLLLAAPFFTGVILRVTALQ